MSTEPLEVRERDGERKEGEQQTPASTEPILAAPRSRRPEHSMGVSLGVLAVIAVLTACYLAKLVCVVLLIAVLIAFILTPLVELLERFRLPRALAAFIAVLLMMGALYGISYYGYSKASDFVHDLPKYSDRIRRAIAGLQKRAESIQKSTQDVLPQSNEKQPQTVTVQQANWGDWLTRGAGSVTEIVFTLGFIPFLVYFMLSWQEHARASTVMLFRMENRNTAYVTLGAISGMIRSFIVGNLLIGIFMGTVASIVFWVMKLPYPFFLGYISGFLSLIPYLGVILGLVPPIVAGLGQIHGADALAIIFTVLALHVFALNVLYPKIVGSRVQLNPLAVTLALLFWGWLWGATGLILAVPITAAMKIIFDHIESMRPYGTWLGE